jgi:putative alpha-1,2-mannosidase
MPGGNILEILAEGNGPDAVYIDEIRFDGKIIEKNYLTHDRLQQGGRLVFVMSDKPDKERGTSPEAYPYSMSRN